LDKVKSYYRWGGFALALLVGRAIRYSMEGYLAVRYGRQAWQLLLRLGPWAFLAVTLAALLFFVLFRLRRNERTKTG